MGGTPMPVRCGVVRPFKVGSLGPPVPIAGGELEVTASPKGGVESNGKDPDDRNESEHDTASAEQRACWQKAKLTPEEGKTDRVQVRRRGQGLLVWLVAVGREREAR